MRKFLLGRESTSVRDSYIWNMIASGVNASEAIVVLMIATRTVGIEDAGILSFAFTVSNLLMTIGKYGVRNFQVTDARDEFAFSDYFGSRVMTVCGMILAAVLFLGWNLLGGNYSQHKAAIIFCVIMIYAVEAFEDVYVGEMQHRQRLDIGSRMFSLRWGGTLFAWSGGLLVTSDALLSAVVALVVDSMLLIWFLRILCGSYTELRMGSSIGIDLCSNMDRMQRLQLVTFPLFASSFLDYYITNASKYAIDACLTDRAQACYGFVAMPVFVIGLLNSIIYQPILVKMSIEWNEGRIDRFLRVMVRQMVLIALISVFCILCACFFGIPVLSWLYATDLSDYKFELIILLVGGMWLAYAGFLGTVMTLMRKQKLMLYVYAVIAILAFLVSKPIVSSYDVRGAAVSNSVWMLLESLAFGVIVGVYLQKEGKRRKNMHE